MFEESVTGKDAAPCLVVFCKRPALFHGKQRLAGTIGAQQALIFAGLFLDCALEDAHSWDGPFVISPACPESRDWAGGLLDGEHMVMAQPEGCLGHRLQTIDRQLRDRGYDRIIFMGSDAPTLKTAHFDETVRALRTGDIVLSPALDGGVTIMAARRPWPDLTVLPWSRDILGRSLAQHCRNHGLEVCHISPGYDIDVATDLIRLHQDLASDPRPARQNLYGALCDFLEQGRVGYG